MEAPMARRKLFFGLFIFPLVIAVGMALILCTVVFMTSEKETPETLISAIKSSSESRRWQKAYELSNELNRGAGNGVRSSALMKEIIYILQDTAQYDSKTRGYMALALSHFNDPEAVAALKDALKGDADEICLYALWSLGALSDRTAASSVAVYLKSDNPELRKMAVYVMGILADPSYAPAIRKLLTDPVADVRWNSALALARLGDDSGFEILTQMLDRKTFLGETSMNEEQIERAMTNAIKGLVLIRRPESITILQSVSKDEKNMRIRQAAIEAFKSMESKEQS